MKLYNSIYFCYKTLVSVSVSVLVFACLLGMQTAQPKESATNLKVEPVWALAIHGGAAGFTRETWDDFEKKTGASQELYRAVLTEALHAGSAVLKENGNALDAVEAAIVILEDSPLFNAGKGAVFNAKGGHELDASIMDGTTLNAGAVAGVTTVKNPIKAARQVMDHSKHVLLQGAGAEQFSAERELELVDNTYFSVDYLQRLFDKWKKKNSSLLNPNSNASNLESDQAGLLLKKFGTVGAVALDMKGNFAAGTSTGGLSYKSYGRVGDSPIIGAGTYAANGLCAVSGTGEGEYFIRLSVARTICAEIEYNNVDGEMAGERVIGSRLTALGGYGGVIVLDAKGNASFSFNTPSMFRASVTSAGKTKIKIFK